MIMKLEARFGSKPPQEIVDVQRLKVIHGELEIEISLSGAGLLVRLNEPFGDQLVVYPQATNGVTLRAGHE
jgi:hypothetical protein